jgi:hypothetical protein
VLNCDFSAKATRLQMAEKHPFLEDGSQFGISRTAFRRMRKDEKRELMIQWFHQNYEDPAERTSYVSAEGGYLWNHGGPHDATEQLYDMFGQIVSEKLIEEVAEEVEADGITDWAPVHDEYQDDDELLSDSPALDEFSDKPTDQYGSALDLEAREHARVVLQDLLAILNEPKPAGIGHNNPPDEIEEFETAEELRTDVVALHAEFGKKKPSISLVKKLGTTLRHAAIASVKWAGHKIDLAFDTAIKAGIPAAGLVLSAKYSEQLHKALDTVITWLEIVAQKL